ncbi:nitrate- and nitrite sensing domain-containing protein [Streptomyces sp. P9-2B-2]|uniref:sensor histidine kinase n=1 Tax=Streptomyces sp. P9-2B-2 TaxID=3057114 RepID=UPI0025B467A3|nr:nitrate- and nitrite sensing domain-containing protein [Streptomyces sp. P9-2B-2]WJY41976.1 nitrate- and nitrite sensing domain-containing protein [Streptomyces sp. P9-2B-2]
MHIRQTPDGSGPAGEAQPPGNNRPRHALPAVAMSWKFATDYRVRLMPRSVRAKIVALLMVPVVSLIALWAFATVTTARNVSDLQRLKDVNATLVAPVGDFVSAVQEERSAAARALASPDSGRQQTLRERQRATDSAAVALRDGIDSGSADAETTDAQLPGRIDRLLHDADGLAALRGHVDGHKPDRDRLVADYTGLIEDGFATVGALTGLETTAVSSEARVVLELSRAREALAHEDALLGAAQLSGRMSPGQFDAFTGAVHTQRALFTAAIDDLRPRDAAAYHRILDGAAYRELRAAENAVRDAGSGIRAATAVPAVRWTDVSDTVLHDLRTAQRAASTGAARDADPLSAGTLGGPGIAVVLGLAGVLLSLLISVKIGRRLVVELEQLRNSALRVARRDLPASMRLLHAGKKVDIDAVAPLGDRGTGRDEVGQVGEALVAVHRAALQAAAGRAEALSGISGVYVSLARRSQLLLHRQLALLDTMERRTEDPAELEDLFRLDHLTTRMRRHAESLIILSGAAPGRGWRHPVPLLDVVRAAVAEVEDFPRVEVHSVVDARLAGGAVADLTHLLAELVENAVMFSPPQTKVQVRAERVGSGIAVEIHDRGLGMGKEALDEANRRIQDAEEIDLLDTEQLGLFVVNRLAHRRHVKVALQPSVYGGITAVVLVPDALFAAGADEEPADVRSTEQSEAGASLFHRRRSAAHRTPVAAAPRRNELPPAAADTATEQPAAEQSSPATAAQPSEAAADPEAALPRRVRQAHLAPELRTSPDQRPEWVPRTEGMPAPRRSPEQARATMASLRAGWARGRGDTPAPQAPRREPPEQPHPQVPRQPNGANDNPSRGEDTR